MIRGTTPTIKFTTSLETDLLNTAYITFSQNGKLVFEKTLSECTLETKAITLKLTQEETLKLQSGISKVEIQIRAKTADGTVMATDIGAYNFGMLFGKHKLCPNISPKKTIEGAIGGALSGAIFGTGYITLLTFLLEPACEYQIRFLNIESNVWYLIAIFGIALIVSIAGQLGDLVASKLKREYEIKDYGKIFPGHGGVLDRFDSTILGGIVFYIIIFIIGVI